MRIYLSTSLPTPRTRLTYWVEEYRPGETFQMNVGAWFGAHHKGKYIKLADIPSGYTFSLITDMYQGPYENSYNFKTNHHRTTTDWLPFKYLRDAATRRPCAPGLYKDSQQIRGAQWDSITFINFIWDPQYIEVN
ncbi:hypothetical protein [Pseudomonas sp. UFMG81]|uniref:hypothetical protein n=1 Tax=Pseudomonas sp. UFMG81 TaxID=2745936 RepID=UPI001890A879|nr:hypothetical protein [Pseudomonas sp. UFMG81]